MLAYCQNCGAKTQAPLERCGRCSFDPDRTEDCALRAIYLSTARFEDPGAAADYEADLHEMARAIRRGDEIEFDELELERLRGRIKVVKRSTLSATILRTLIRTAIPGIIFLALLWAIRYFVNSLD
ncbi:MAG: hypothetical protein R3F11_22535 [Verrucomicrobiales bacterium]